jgi:hypothetical protein
MMTTSNEFTLNNENIDHIFNIYNQLTRSVQHKIKERQNLNNGKKKTIKTNKFMFFNSHEEDQLFWYYYITMESKYDYENMKNKYIVEKETKINLINKIRKNKEVLKQFKWKKSEIENNLVYDKTISLTTFICICYINEINVMYVNNNTYYELNNKFDNYIFIKKLNDKFIFYENKDNDICEKMDEARLKKWRIDNINKPLKNITAYKLSELQKIAEKFNIAILNIGGKKKTKKVLYAAILEKID